MSIKYINILETVEDDGIKLSSYYGKYLVNSYDEALIKAKEYGFAAGVRVDGVEKSDLFINKEEFEDIVKDKDYPIAIVPVAL